MIGKYDNILAGKNQTIKVLWFAVCLATAVAAFNGTGWILSPKAIRIHLPPDISSGAVMAPGEAGKSNVYAFAYYIWQQLNRWERDGSIDYEDRIYSLQAYLTPSCFQDRMDDYAAKKARHEIDRRSRSVWEIPGRAYADHRVTVNADGKAWTVRLDLHINETMLGEPVKNRLVQYPLSVVKYNVDPERNPFGLAVNCLAGVPRVIEGGV